jgi:hypothetical protein
VISQLYALAVGATTAGCYVFRDRADFRTGVALLVNWCATMAIYASGPMETVWAPLIVLDGLTAWVVLRQPARLVQGIIGGLLLGQVVFHVAFGWVGTSESFDAYRLAINLAGWAQVGTLFGSAFYDGGRKMGLWLGWPRDRAGAPAAGVARLDERGGP